MENFEKFRGRINASLGKEGASVAMLTFNILRNIHLISTAFNSVMSTDSGKSLVESITKSIGYITPEFGELKKAHLNFEVDLLYKEYKRLTVDKCLEPDVALTLIDIATNKNRGR